MIDPVLKSLENRVLNHMHTPRRTSCYSCFKKIQNQVHVCIYTTFTCLVWIKWWMWPLLTCEESLYHPKLKYRLVKTSAPDHFVEPHALVRRSAFWLSALLTPTLPCPPWTLVFAKMGMGLWKLDQGSGVEAGGASNWNIPWLGTDLTKESLNNTNLNYFLLMSCWYQKR